MAARSEITNMALFCDFENVALGVSDAKYSKFDIDKVLERGAKRANEVANQVMHRVRDAVGL